MRLRLYAAADMHASFPVSSRAQVGNAYTFASNSVGSLVKIGSDPAGCGTSGTFSTGSSPKAFASTVTISSIYAGVASGYQTLLDTLRGSADPTSTYVATLQGASADSCIKRFESLAVQARAPLLPWRHCNTLHTGCSSPRPWSSAYVAGSDCGPGSQLRSKLTQLHVVPARPNPSRA